MTDPGQPERMPPDIRALTAAMRWGDEAAWRTFYEYYHDRLLRYLVVVTRAETVAREVLQQTLLRVVRHVRTFEDELVFWSWLTVLARSAAADHGRKHRRYFAFLDRFLRHSATEEHVPDADTRLMELLEEGLQALPSDERWLIEQKYLANRCVREMAASMHATEKAVEGKLGRVRRKLKAVVLEKLNHEKDT